MTREEFKTLEVGDVFTYVGSTGSIKCYVTDRLSDTEILINTPGFKNAWLGPDLVANIELTFKDVVHNSKRRRNVQDDKDS